MTKKLRKKIMKRSKLRNNVNNNGNHESWCKYETQRNYCVNHRKSKKQRSNNRNVSHVTDNKSFWKSVLTLFQ